jgi:hypothetical protein
MEAQWPSAILRVRLSPFLPEEFFNGRLEGWGVLESFCLQKRSTITAEGYWERMSRQFTSPRSTVSMPATKTACDGRSASLVEASTVALRHN